MFPINQNIIPQLMNRLQKINPQGFQFINTAMRNGGNPNLIANQMLNQLSPEQKQGLMNNAKPFGITENYFNQLQNYKPNNNTQNNSKVNNDKK
ncbi:MAG: hypothetical protein IJH55_07575 [Romboutsia sp.]|nr:hypothetical protein [Romboutsia sp.]